MHVYVCVCVCVYGVIVPRLNAVKWKRITKFALPNYLHLTLSRETAQYCAAAAIMKPLFI